MALRIHKARLAPAAKEPVPLYQMKLQQLLRPNHPVFNFALLRQDLATTFDFEVGIRGQVETVLGTFPGFWFDRMRRSETQADLAASWRLFEEYVFKVAVRALEHLHRNSAKQRADLDLVHYYGGLKLFETGKFLDRLLSKTPYYLNSYERISGEGPEEPAEFVICAIGDDRESVAFTFPTNEPRERLEKQATAAGLSVNELQKKRLTEFLVLSLYRARWADGNTR